LTTAARLASFDLVNRVPRSRDSREEEERMLRNTLYVKFVLLMLVLAALTMVLGTDPWGPD
jgi:hypothetical protein